VVKEGDEDDPVEEESKQKNPNSGPRMQRHATRWDHFLRLKPRAPVAATPMMDETQALTINAPEHVTMSAAGLAANSMTGYTSAFAGQ